MPVAPSEFLEYISKNYDRLKKELSYPDPDLFQDMLITIHTRIEKGKVTFDTLHDCIKYLTLALRNKKWESSKASNKFVTLTYEPSYEEDTPEPPPFENLYKELMDFVHLNFPPLDAYLFREYIIHRTTFKKLAQGTGFSETFVFKKIKAVREAVKLHYTEVKQLYEVVCESTPHYMDFSTWTVESLVNYHYHHTNTLALAYYVLSLCEDYRIQPPDALAMTVAEFENRTEKII